MIVSQILMYSFAAYEVLVISGIDSNQPDRMSSVVEQSIPIKRGSHLDEMLYATYSTRTRFVVLRRQTCWSKSRDAAIRLRLWQC